ncbi:10725_t:CDS:2 [Racocetra persica]|uniref:10725_t:CDS:1 n=1 Tax=Racocetra persica TaxID=160502 RepID=A0ACA9LLN3_9GLOM|nr:10725_t:CDS:2 [Racocetra persica]
MEKVRGQTPTIYTQFTKEISKKKGDRQWGNRNLKQADDFREDSLSGASEGKQTV